MTPRSGKPSKDATGDRRAIIETSIEERSRSPEGASGDARGDRSGIIDPSIDPRSRSVKEASEHAVPETVAAMTPHEITVADILASIRTRSEAEGPSSRDAARPAPPAPAALKLLKRLENRHLNGLNQASPTTMAYTVQP